MHDPVRLLGSGRLEPKRRRVYAVKQASATAEQDRDEVQADLLDQSRVQALADDVGATHDRDVIVAGSGTSLIEGARDALRTSSRGAAPRPRRAVARPIRPVLW